MLRTVVGFLSRSHGYDILHAIVNSTEYELIHLYTHRLNPSSQDPSRSERDDFHKFKDLCKQNNIPLTCIDSKNEYVDVPECDYIIEVSWRYLIPKNITKKAKRKAFGIHRGKLPEYAGSEPIKQALQHNEKEIALSAHLLDAEIDQGNTIHSVSNLVNYDSRYTLDENIQRLRDEIIPLFSKLFFETIDRIEKP